MITLLLLTALLGSCSGGGNGGSNPVSPSGGNGAPRITALTAEPQEISVGQSAIITVESTDPDGDKLSYRWKASLGYIIGGGPSVQYAASSCCVGENTITVMVDDGNGGRASKSTKVRVNP